MEQTPPDVDRGVDELLKSVPDSPLKRILTFCLSDLKVPLHDADDVLYDASSAVRALRMLMLGGSPSRLLVRNVNAMGQGTAGLAGDHSGQSRPVTAPSDQARSVTAEADAPTQRPDPLVLAQQAMRILTAAHADVATASLTLRLLTTALESRHPFFGVPESH